MPAKKSSVMKKTRRNRVKHPALKKNYNSRIKGEYLDYDYLNKLSAEELDWLHKFTDEELNARFENDGTDLNQSKEERKVIYDRNNSRNRCLLGNLRNRSNAKILNTELNENVIESELNGHLNKDRIEDALVEFIDYQSEMSNNLDNAGNDPSEGQ